MYHWQGDAATVSCLGIADVVHTAMRIKKQRGRKRQNTTMNVVLARRDELD